MVKVLAKIGNHKEELRAFLTTLGHYSLLLGVPLMRDNDVKLDFAENSLESTPTNVTAWLLPSLGVGCVLLLVREDRYVLPRSWVR